MRICNLHRRPVQYCAHAVQRRRRRTRQSCVTSAAAAPRRLRPWPPLRPFRRLPRPTIPRSSSRRPNDRIGVLAQYLDQGRRKGCLGGIPFAKVSDHLIDGMVMHGQMAERHTTDELTGSEFPKAAPGVGYAAPMGIPDNHMPCIEAVCPKEYDAAMLQVHAPR